MSASHIFPPQNNLEWRQFQHSNPWYKQWLKSTSAPRVCLRLSPCVASLVCGSEYRTEGSRDEQVHPFIEKLWGKHTPYEQVITQRRHQDDVRGNWNRANQCIAEASAAQCWTTVGKTKTHQSHRALHVSTVDKTNTRQSTSQGTSCFYLENNNARSCFWTTAPVSSLLDTMTIVLRVL